MNYCKVAIGALLWTALALPAQATTFNVTDATDNNPSDPNSLRYAINNLAPGTAANSNTINFAITPSPAIITVGSTLAITQGLTINGPGAASLAIDGGNAFQIFSIAGGITVSISGLTIQNASYSNASGDGGGISNLGTLTVSDCTLTGNFAASLGAAIYNANGATTTIMGSLITSNKAGDSGALGNDGMMTVINTTISSNSAFEGGGIINNFNGAGATLIVTNTTLSTNMASENGGAISTLNTGGSVTVTGSTFKGNTASREGGAIEMLRGSLTITNSTFYGNSAGEDGGAIETDLGTATVVSSTFSGNLANSNEGIIASDSTFNIKNTILANSGTGGNCSGTFTSFGYNLSDDTSCDSVLTNSTDQNNTAAGLDPSGPQDNGGPTQTIAILKTSHALNAIPTANCTDVSGGAIAVDQRGVTRPQGSACDIGAYEYVMPPKISKSFGASQVPQGGSTTLEIDLANQSSTVALSNVAFSDSLPGGMVIMGAPLTNTCGSGVTATGGSISLTGGTLAAGGSCQIIVIVRAPNQGSFTNTTSTVTSDLGQPGDAASAPILVTPPVPLPVLSKAFSHAAIQRGASSHLTFTISNPDTITLTGLAFTDTLPSGLLISRPSGLTSGCAGASVTATAGTNFIQVSGATLAPGTTCAIGLDVIGVALGVQTNITSGVSSNQTPNGAPASAVIVVGDVYQLTYAANLPISTLDLTNAGSNGGTDPAGDICANVYVFSPDQQLVACCTCPLTPNHLSTLSVRGDLTSNLLTPGAPSSVTIAMLASTTCDPAAVTAGSLVEGLRGWRTTMHTYPGGSFVTENSFSSASLSVGELNKLTAYCGFIEANGSTYGICQSCKTGAAGASHQ